MLLSKEKLPIEIAQIDSIEINDMNLTEAGEDKVLQDFTSDSTSADQEYTRL